jgi:hypothetical protein
MTETNDIRTISKRRSSRSSGARALAATLAACAVLGASPAARADEVEPTGKGIAGCALLGGELVVFGEAIFGVRSTAAYLIGAGAGAVAGGVGGYFLEQSVDDGRIPAYTLAGGLALLIPAVVVTLNQTRYMPTEGAREDKPLTSLPASDPGKPGGSTVIGSEPKGTPSPAPSAPAPAPETTPPAGTPAPPAGGGGGGTPAPLSLFDVHQGAFRVGVPVPQVRPVFTMAQRTAFGVNNAGSELRFPLVRVAF